MSKASSRNAGSPTRRQLLQRGGLLAAEMSLSPALGRLGGTWVLHEMTELRSIALDLRKLIRHV